MADSPDSRVGSSRSRWASFLGLAGLAAGQPVASPSQSINDTANARYGPGNQAARDARTDRQAARPATIASGNARMAANPFNAATNAKAHVDSLVAKAAPSRSVPLGAQYTGSTLRAPAAKAPVAPTAAAKKAPAKAAAIKDKSNIKGSAASGKPAPKPKAA